MRNYIDCSYNIAITSAVDDVECSNITSKNSHIIKSTTIDSLNPNNIVKFSIKDKKIQNLQLLGKMYLKY